MAKTKEQRTEFPTTRRQYDRHEAGSVPMTIWVPKEYKETLQKEAEETGWYRWSLSAHVLMLLDKARGRDDWKRYPARYAPSRH
jgi:hypothetical protein